MWQWEWECQEKRKRCERHPSPRAHHTASTLASVLVRTLQRNRSNRRQIISSWFMWLWRLFRSNLQVGKQTGDPRREPVCKFKGHQAGKASVADKSNGSLVVNSLLLKGWWMVVFFLFRPSTNWMSWMRPAHITEDTMLYFTNWSINLNSKYPHRNTQNNAWPKSENSMPQLSWHKMNHCNILQHSGILNILQLAPNT